MIWRIFVCGISAVHNTLWYSRAAVCGYISFPLSENKAGILQIAAIPTIVYTILASRLPAPKMNATRSKLRIPISPQLMPPTISRAIQIL